MVPNILERAVIRLDRAKRAFGEVLNATDSRAFDHAWTDFLVHSNAIYSKVEQAAKGSPQSTYWFGTKKKERRDDPLLAYMHQARNSDEHGEAAVFENLFGLFGPMKEAGRVTKMVCNDGVPTLVEITYESGKIESFEMGNPRPVLRTVRDSRYDDEFPPPTMHKGRQVDMGNPYAAGQLLLAHLEALIDEAAGLIPDTSQ